MKGCTCTLGKKAARSAGCRRLLLAADVRVRDQATIRRAFGGLEPRFLTAVNT